MIVKHNITAMNSNRMLGLTTASQAKSTEKLSSGYKINRAADDAAGLAISEKMRRQIRGLTQASANAQDGISAVQTAEGAMNEIQDMLQRMNELAIKAGNGTMSESDKQSVQDEIDQLITEIDRVSETTKFNETYLLKGSGNNKNADMVSGHVDGKIQEAAVTEARGNIFEATFNSDADTMLDAGTQDVATIEYLDENGDKRTKDVVFKAGKDAGATAANLADAIKKDDVLKHIFTASSTKDGKISVESKLDGTKTDDTKNAVQSIKFESATKKATADGKRLNGFKEIADQTAAADTDYAKLRTAAIGESYTISIGGKEGASTAGTKVTLDTGAGKGILQDGESITINGKTYTYDANKATTEEANTFKTLDDLNKLLEADGYKASVVATATQIDKTYAADNTLTGTKKSDYSIEMLAAKNGSTALGAIADTDFHATDFLKGAAHQNNTADVATNFENIKIELRITEMEPVAKETDTLHFSLQVGADTTEENKIAVDIQSMSAKSLGINKVSVTGEDSTNADKAVNTISDAIAKVSAQRSALGAIQNRLEHTINNLDNVVENTTSAEAAIRDTDIAEEMVKYANNNILQQAGTSMLSQANQSNQLALSLLG